MTAIATLAVNVVSNTGGLTKGLSKARSSMNQTGASSGKLGGMLGKMNPLMIGIGAAAAGAAVAVAKIGAAMSRLDEIGKRSTSLGILPQQLMAFNNASVLGGVGADKMSKGLQKMQRGVGEAALGVGTLKVALDEMNIDVDKFKHLSPDEQFKTFADSIANIKNPAERAAHATNIFGKAGADLIPMLSEGRAGIEAIEKETERLQGTMSQMDIKAVEDSNDAWAKFGMAMEGIWNQLAVAVAPALEAVGNLLAGIAGSVARIVDAWNDYWKTDADRAAEGQAERLAEHERKVAAAFDEQTKAAEEAAKAREELEKKGVALAESLKTPVEMYNDKIAEFDSLLKEGAITWETYKRAAKKATDELKRSEEFKKREIQASERQAVGVSLRGSTSSIAVQQKQVRTMEKLLAEEKLARQEEQRQTDLLQGILQNTGSANVVSI